MKGIAVVLLMAPLCVSAQSVDSALHVGARVRVVAADSDSTASVRTFTHAAGNLAALDGSALVVQPTTAAPNGLGAPARLPVDRIILAEVFVGRRRHPIVGSLVGLTTGVFVGFIVGYAGSGGGVNCVSIGGAPFCKTARGKADQRTHNAEKFGAIGAASGALLGYFIRTERWRTVDLGPLRVQVGIR